MNKMKNKLKIIIGAVVIIALIAVCGILVFNGVKAKNEAISHPVASFDIQDLRNSKI